MAYPEVLQDLQTCVELGVPSRVPIFALGEEFDVEQYDIDYRVYITSPEDMIKCWVQAAERFDYDWILLHPDDYIEIEPLGVETLADSKVPPSPTSQPRAEYGTLKQLRMPDASSAGRMPHHIAALQGIKEAMGDSVCLAGRVAAPFSAVGLLYGVQEALMLMMTDPQLFRDTAEFMCELMMYWAQEQIEAGADALWVGDCVASSGFLSPGHYAEFAAPGAQVLCEAIKKAGAWAIYHAGDDSLEHLKLSAQFRPSMLNLGEGIDLRIVKREIGSQVCLSGNVNPIKLFEARDLSEVEAETVRVIQAGKPGGGYVFNTGEGVPRQTDPRIIETMMRSAKQHCQYEKS